jgi:hypothetical protein
MPAGSVPFRRLIPKASRERRGRAPGCPHAPGRDPAARSMHGLHGSKPHAGDALHYNTPLSTAQHRPAGHPRCPPVN